MLWMGEQPRGVWVREGLGCHKHLVRMRVHHFARVQKRSVHRLNILIRRILRHVRERHPWDSASVAVVHHTC